MPTPLARLPKRRQAQSPSAAVCLVQQAYHQDRALHAALANERIVSAKAATAWGAEAVLAESREERYEKTRATAESILTKQQLADEFAERRLCENPDRGFANP